MISIYAIKDFPIIEPNNARLPEILAETLKKQSFKIEDGDILVIAHSIVSRSEGAIISLNSITPSEFALELAKNSDKDPRKIEVVLRESKTIVRMRETLIISENKLGIVCANAGVDSSNAWENSVLILPNDPDGSAREIMKTIFNKFQIKIGVIITDTFGRPLRVGTTNIAIGIAGLVPLEEFGGEKDIFGYTLQSTIVARADELATAAGLIIGQAGEKIPVALIKGFKGKILSNQQHTAKELIRKREDALFW